MENKRALILLFIANAISGFAQGISMLAIPWYFARQNSSDKFNLIYATVTFITMFWGLYAGTLVDRFNRKRVFLTTNIAEGTMLLLIASYGFINGSLPIPLIVLAFMTTIFGYQIHYPNLYAFVQQITKPGEYSKVTSTIEIVGQSTSVAAGAMAALLLEGVDSSRQVQFLGQSFSLGFTIPKWELYEIFLLDGLTYVIAVILIFFIKFTSVKTFEVDTNAFLTRLRTGFSYLKHHPLIFTFGLLSYTVFACVLVKIHGLMPMYVNNHLEAGGAVFGLAEVLYAVGALSAGIFVARVFSTTPTPVAVVSLMFLAVFVYYLAASTKYIPIYLGICTLVGFANAGIRILRVTFIFSTVPNELIGRVNSVFSMGNVLMRVSFLLLFSNAFFKQGSNVTYAYAILASFMLLAAITLLINRKKITSLALLN